MNKELIEYECIMVIGAMKDAELDLFINSLKNIVIEKEGIYTFYVGNMFDKKIVVCVSKIGTINAACATTLGIIRYKPQCIIAIGVAGGYGEDVCANDLVIASEIINISSFVTPERLNGEGSNSLSWRLEDFTEGSTLILKSDEKLLNLAKEVENMYSFGGVHYGKIASGDCWNKEADRIMFFHEKYGLLCEEMEGAAIYQISSNFNIPTISFRAISNNEVLHEKYNRNVGEYVQKFTIEFIRKYFDK